MKKLLFMLNKARILLWVVLLVAVGAGVGLQRRRGLAVEVSLAGRERGKGVARENGE